MTKKQQKMRNRILVSFVLFVVLFVLRETGYLEALPSWALFVLFAVPYLIVGHDVLLRAAKNIRNGQVFDENFLMTIATFAAFALREYPEGCAVMLFYQVGELFQGYAVGKSRASITQMMEIVPEYANVETAQGLEKCDPEDVAVGSIIVVKPGERIPLDGEVIEGESFLDTAALTGESVPRSVRAGDACISGCVNGEGTLRLKTTKRYEDSTVARILDLVENASDKKARLENFITRFARIYTPVVTIGAVLLALLPPLFFGGGFKDWILRGCTFLIVSCPCALVISVPLGFFGGIGAASKIGVLVKGSNYLEAASKVDTVVMDKTGTLTKGEFKVQALYPAPGTEEGRLLQLAALAEVYSNHPIAVSIRAAYEETREKEGSAHLANVSDVTEHAGRGVTALYEGKRLIAGNHRLMEEEEIPYAACDASGTIVYVAYDGHFAGSLVIADAVKEDALQAVAAMRAQGIKRTVMLTGDHADAAQSVADACHIDEVHAELLPADKVKKLEEIMFNQQPDTTLSGCVRTSEFGRARECNYVAFVGDGVNDAPVLMRADVGIAMGSLGSDAAIEAADIVIMDDDLAKVPVLLRIAKKTMSIVKQNIVFAIGVKVLILFLGALGLANLWLAVFADVGVAFLAILNSMRTLRM